MVRFLIHKPIAVLMTITGIIILGIYSLGFIPVSLMPDIDIPEITVQVQADNMSSRQMEDAIIKLLRNRLIQVSHLKDIKSEATNGNGVIKLSFNHNTNIDYAFIEVNEKIDRAITSLPKTIDRPKVIKASATDIPVFYLSMTIDKDQIQNGNIVNKNLYPVSQEFIDFNKFSKQVISKRIEQLDEVAMVDMSGLLHSEILIIPNYKKIDAIGLSLNEIESAIKENDLEIGSLLIKDNQYQYDIRLGNSLKNIEDIENIFIKKSNRIFQLKELAQVIEHPQKRTGLVLSHGKEAVTMAIIKQSDAKMTDLKDALNERIEQLKKDYPEINFTVTRDQTKLLDFAINNLFQSLLWGMLLAFIMLFLFLKNSSSPLLIGITIPTSLIICLLFFKLLNISINIISLSGLVLGIGLMIDNSIIVIDNITQYRNLGNTLSKACVLGVNEVIKPLLSSALTTCAVFIPLVFLSGISGALFYDQAMAISIGLFVSLLVSITLLPVVYRLFHLKKSIKKNRLNTLLEKYNSLDYELLYEKGFKWVIRKQHLSWSLSFFLLLITIILFNSLPKTQMPAFTSKETLLKIDWNEPINVGENKRRILELISPIEEELIAQTALVGTQQFLLNKDTNTKSSESSIYLNFKTEIKFNELTSKLSSKIRKLYPNAIYEYQEVDNIFSLIFSNKEAPLLAKLKTLEGTGTHHNEQLEKVWYKIQKNTESQKLKPINWQDYIVLQTDREKLITYNITPNEVLNTLKSAFNERKILSIVDNQNFVPVVLGNNVKDIKEILSETKITSKDSAFFNISNFVTLSLIKDLKTITGGKEGEYYPIPFYKKELDVNSTITKVNQAVSENNQFDITFSGSFFTNKAITKELITVLLISLLLLYFILASQFESFLLPLIILVEVPIDLAGAFLFLKLFGMSINLMSMIGIVVMSGIIINDSILKIDTIIQLQKRGFSLLKALLIAGKRRLKPILMTSLTTILALVPLLFSRGLGAELQKPLAIALIGGMLVGTLISLYFIPLCYYYFSKNKSRYNA